MVEKKETKIKKIVLNIEGKELILSLEGAKELKTLLNDLFGREVVKEHHHHTYNRPWYYGWNPDYGLGTLQIGTAIGSLNSSENESYGKLTTSNEVNAFANLLAEKGVQL